jgi:transketolase
MKATRDSFGETILRLGENDSRIVVLDADLSKSTKSESFSKKFQDRFFQMGIAEMNMIGTAAGLALGGKIPFACSFGCFLTGRYDQIRMSVAYNRANVKLVGTHAGVAIGEDGHSQMALEDIGLMRGLPNMIVLQPADHFETVRMMEAMVEISQPCYLRLTRQKMPLIYDESYRFKIGKWDVLREGKEVLLIGTGHQVHSCLEANEKKSNPWTVVNASSLNPIDKDLLKSLISKHRFVVTAEDHYIVNGLGSAVAEFLAEQSFEGRLYRIGLGDFGESGSPEELYRHFRLDGAGVLSQVENFLQAQKDR